jgi:uncharacterized protein involved in exopolysaccharide biosynthesis
VFFSVLAAARAIAQSRRRKRRMELGKGVLHLPEEDEAGRAPASAHFLSRAAAAASPRGVTDASKAKEEEKEGDKHPWTVAELKRWAARLDARERAISEREAQLDQRARWLDQQQVRSGGWRGGGVASALSFSFVLYF